MKHFKSLILKLVTLRHVLQSAQGPVLKYDVDNHTSNMPWHSGIGHKKVNGCKDGLNSRLHAK
jgi:hypothetical protein